MNPLPPSSPALVPHDGNYASRIRTSFARQRIMATIGASLVSVAPGAVEIVLPFREDLVQQHGLIHAGIVTTILDNACGYSALGLMRPDAAVLTVEYKVNFLAPARGERILARGRVIRPGQTLIVCAADALAVTGGEEKLVATMLATMIAAVDRSDLPPGL